MFLHLQPILLFLDHNEYFGEGDSNLTKFGFQILATLGAIGVAYLGFWWTKRKEKKNKAAEIFASNIKLLQYVITSNENVLSEMIIQEENLRNVVKQIRIDSLAKINFKFNTSVFFDWYDSIDKPDFRNAFFLYVSGSEEEKIEWYKLLITRTIHLRQVHNQLQGDYSNFMRELRPLNLDFRTSFREFISCIFRQLSNVPIDTQVSPHKELIEVANMYNNTEQEKKNNQFFYDEIVMPVKKLREEGHVFLSIGNELTYVLDSFEFMKDHFDNYREQFSKYADSYKEGHEKISLVLSKMNPMTFENPS